MVMPWIIFILSLIWSVALSRAELAHPLLARANCASHVWRTDEAANLPGKCYGVNPHIEFDDLKNIPIHNWADCRALCCNLSERCTVWQYLNTSKTCYIQKRPVRRGPEGADTALYCDPYPTHRWNGKFLGTRTAGSSSGSSTCTWAYEIPRQCFAFGPERVRTSTGEVRFEDGDKTKGVGHRLATSECEQACCNDPSCNSWQEYPGRGCFFGKSDCKYEEPEGIYEGGRKCLPGFCAGKEKDIILPEQYGKLQALVQSFKD
jgi:hypothetical protein